jgi:DNA-binding MarR family transcriptional regulator
MATTRGTPVLPAAGEGKRGAQGHIAYLLRQAQAAVRQALDARLAAAGVTTPQFVVLNLLDAYPGASGAELARVAQLTPQTLNLVVRKLERDGLIGRTEHETHGRVLRMALTPVGRKRLRQCKELADGVERRLVASLDAGSERRLRRWLAEVATSLMRDAEGAG